MYYPTRYVDDLGSVDTIIFNNGQTLSMKIRDVLFRGCDFDSLEPEENYTKEDLKSFTLQHNTLCNCIIESRIPLIIVEKTKENFCFLEMRLILGKPDHRNAINREDLFLKLKFGNKIYESKETAGFFEDGLISIEKMLPDDIYIKCCFTCIYSDYSPFGQGLFGSLACFRDVKEDYFSLGSKYDVKHDLLNLWERRTEFVQEICLCPEYKKRKSGTGYRG